MTRTLESYTPIFRMSLNNPKPTLSLGASETLSDRVGYFCHLTSELPEGFGGQRDHDVIPSGLRKAKGDEPVTRIVGEGPDLDAMFAGGDDELGHASDSYSEALGDVGYDPEDIGVYFVRLTKTRAAIGVYACRLADLTEFVDEKADPDLCEYTEVHTGGFTFGGSIDLAVAEGMSEDAFVELTDRQSREAFNNIGLTESWLDGVSRAEGQWFPVADDCDHVREEEQ